MELDEAELEVVDLDDIDDEVTPVLPVTRRRGASGTAMRRIGNLAAVAVVTSLTIAMPSALRLSEGGLSLASAWLATGAVLCTPIAMAIALLRTARPALQEWSSPIAGARGLTLLVWIVLALPLNRALAVLLAVHTHHRGLGGAAFGVGSLVISGTTALIAWRLGCAVALRWRETAFRPFERPRRRGARTNAMAWLLVACAVLWTASQGLGVRAESSAAEAGGIATAAELGWGCIALAAASLVETNIGWGRLPSIAGIVTFGLFVLCGAAELIASGEMREALAAEAPLAGSLLESLGVGTAPNPSTLTARVW
jgi:hypothetical protein